MKYVCSVELAELYYSDRQEKDISQPASQNKTCGDDAAALQPATAAGIYVYV